MAVARRAALILLLAGLVPALGVDVAAQPLVGGPSWSELSPAERQVLAPLAPDWNQMDAQRRLKWLGIARRYPTMRRDEQDRIQAQMQGWARLTPDQRRAAREQFKSINQLPPDQRRDVQRKWEEYRSLPAERRRELANQPPPTAKPPPPASRGAPPPKGASEPGKQR